METTNLFTKFYNYFSGGPLVETMSVKEEEARLEVGQWAGHQAGCWQPCYNLTTGSYQPVVVQRSPNPPELQLLCHVMEQMQVLASSKLNPNAQEFRPRLLVEETKQEGPMNSQAEQSQVLVEESEEEFIVIENCICDKTDTEEESEAEEDDWDWDTDEEYSSQPALVDPAEFEDLFCPRLLVTNLIVSASPACTEVSAVPAEGASRDSCDGSPCRERRQSWRSPAAGRRLVRFCSEVRVIEEPVELGQQLAAARAGDWAQRQADRERMEQLLRPVLSPAHREAVFRARHNQTE